MSTGIVLTDKPWLRVDRYTLTVERAYQVDGRFYDIIVQHSGGFDELANHEDLLTKNIQNVWLACIGGVETNQYVNHAEIGFLLKGDWKTQVLSKDAIPEELRSSEIDLTVPQGLRLQLRDVIQLENNQQIETVHAAVDALRSQLLPGGKKATLTLKARVSIVDPTNGALNLAGYRLIKKELLEFLDLRKKNKHFPFQHWDCDVALFVEKPSLISHKQLVEFREALLNYALGQQDDVAAFFLALRQALPVDQFERAVDVFLLSVEGLGPSAFADLKDKIIDQSQN